MKVRRLGRELALQALYAYETADSTVGETIEYLCGEKKVSDESKKFGSELANAAMEHLSELDNIIAAQAKNWELSRVTVIDKNVLRMAICEMLYFEDIPAKVSIDEAIELAKKYSTEKSGKFVNGILDPIAKEKAKKL